MSDAVRLAAELGSRETDCVCVPLASQLVQPLVAFDADQHNHAQERIALQERRMPSP